MAEYKNCPTTIEGYRIENEHLRLSYDLSKDNYAMSIARLTEENERLRGLLREHGESVPKKSERQLVLKIPIYFQRKPLLEKDFDHEPGGFGCMAVVKTLLGIIEAATDIESDRGCFGCGKGSFVDFHSHGD